MNVRLYGVTAKKHNEIMNAFNEDNIQFATEWDSEPELYNISFDTSYDMVKVIIHDNYISIITLCSTIGVEVNKNDFEIIKIV